MRAAGDVSLVVVGTEVNVIPAPQAVTLIGPQVQPALASKRPAVIARARVLDPVEVSFGIGGRALEDPIPIAACDAVRRKAFSVCCLKGNLGWVVEGDAEHARPRPRRATRSVRSADRPVEISLLPLGIEVEGPSGALLGTVQDGLST